MEWLEWPMVRTRGLRGAGCSVGGTTLMIRYRPMHARLYRVRAPGLADNETLGTPLDAIVRLTPTVDVDAAAAAGDGKAYVPAVTPPLT